MLPPLHIRILMTILPDVFLVGTALRINTIPGSSLLLFGTRYVSYEGRITGLSHFMIWNIYLL